MDNRDDNIYTRFHERVKRDITNYVLNRLEEKDRRRERQITEQYAASIICVETGEILTKVSAAWAKRHLREGKTAVIAGKHYRYAKEEEIEDDSRRI